MPLGFVVLRQMTAAFESSGVNFYAGGFPCEAPLGIFCDVLFKVSLPWECCAFSSAAVGRVFCVFTFLPFIVLDHTRPELTERKRLRIRFYQSGCRKR